MLNDLINRFCFFGRDRHYSNPKKGSELLLNFDAKEVFLVMRPKDEKNPSKIKVYLDDRPVPADDSDVLLLTVAADRLYKLINLPQPGRHILKLEFLDSNTEVYAFTFG